MATYAKLSLGAGGGIIDRRKQSKQEGDAHVIFALGGTGDDVAKETKKKVYKRIRSDDPDACDRNGCDHRSRIYGNLKGFLSESS